MEKIPTIFDRDWDGNRGVINKPIPDCDWVFNGEGWAAEKVDGTNIKVKIKDGAIIQVWKRRNPTKEEKRIGREPYYVQAEPSDPQDKHIFRAVDDTEIESVIPDGEYSCEAYGGKIQGNPLNCTPSLYFFEISPMVYEDVPRDYSSLKEFLSDLHSKISPNCHAEGIVFHHQDGRMAKIKRKDFK